TAASTNDRQRARKRIWRALGEASPSRSDVRLASNAFRFRPALPRLPARNEGSDSGEACSRLCYHSRSPVYTSVPLPSRGALTLAQRGVHQRLAICGGLSTPVSNRPSPLALASPCIASIHSTAFEMHTSAGHLAANKQSLSESHLEGRVVGLKSAFALITT